jgi:hypothetical protein
MEDKVPNAPQDVERLFAWFSGLVAVSSFNVIVSGRREDVPTEFGVFACLYPDPPHYRAYTAETAPTDADKLRQARRDIAEIHLPADSEGRYQEWMRRNAPLVGPAAGWTAAELTARSWGIPIGCYAVGRTVARHEPRGMLWMMATVSPTTFVERLQEAARS